MLVHRSPRPALLVLTTVSGSPGAPALPLRLIFIFVSPSCMLNSNMEDFSIIFTSFSIFSKSISFSPYIRLLKQPAETLCNEAALEHFFTGLIDLSAQFIDLCHFVQQKLLGFLYRYRLKAHLVVSLTLCKLRDIYRDHGRDLRVSAGCLLGRTEAR